MDPIRNSFNEGTQGFCRRPAGRKCRTRIQRPAFRESYPARASQKWERTRSSLRVRARFGESTNCVLLQHRWGLVSAHNSAENDALRHPEMESIAGSQEGDSLVEPLEVVRLRRARQYRGRKSLGVMGAAGVVSHVVRNLLFQKHPMDAILRSSTQCSYRREDFLAQRSRSRARETPSQHALQRRSTCNCAVAGVATIALREMMLRRRVGDCISRLLFSVDDLSVREYPTRSTAHWT